MAPFGLGGVGNSLNNRMLYRTSTPVKPGLQPAFIFPVLSVLTIIVVNVNGWVSFYGDISVAKGHKPRIFVNNKQTDVKTYEKALCVINRPGSCSGLGFFVLLWANSRTINTGRGECKSGERRRTRTPETGHGSCN